MTKAEILNPSPDIMWANNTYDPKTGDFKEGIFGIVRIGIGQTVYSLKGTDNLNLIATSRQVDTDPSYTRIWLGRLGASGLPPIKVVGVDEKPFSFDDVNRINSAARVAARLKETLEAITASRKVRDEGEKFLLNLEVIGLGKNTNIWQQLAVLKETLEVNIGAIYPAKFLEIADEMDRLGIKEIDIEGGSPRTSEFIRQLFAKKEVKTS